MLRIGEAYRTMVLSLVYVELASLGGRLARVARERELPAPLAPAAVEAAIATPEGERSLTSSSKESERSPTACPHGLERAEWCVYCKDAARVSAIREAHARVSGERPCGCASRGPHGRECQRAA